MNKKQKKTLNLTLGGVGLVIAASLLTIGGFRLFKQTADKDDVVLKKQLHIELNEKFFKDVKETTEAGTGGNYQLLTYTVPKKDYEIKISNYVGTDETPFDFKTALKFNSGPTCGSITITNLEGFIIEFSGKNAKYETVKESHQLVYEEGSNETASKSIFENTGSSAITTITKIESFTIYGK